MIPRHLSFQIGLRKHTPDRFVFDCGSEEEVSTGRVGSGVLSCAQRLSCRTGGRVAPKELGTGLVVHSACGPGRAVPVRSVLCQLTGEADAF